MYSQFTGNRAQYFLMGKYIGSILQLFISIVAPTIDQWDEGVYFLKIQYFDDAIAVKDTHWIFLKLGGFFVMQLLNQ